MAFQVSNNTRFQTGDGGGIEVFAVVPGVKTIGEVGTDTGLIEATSFDSRIKDFAGGMQEGKEFTIEGNLITGDVKQDALRADAAANVRRNIKILFQNDDGTTVTVFETWDFETIVRDFVIKGEQEDAMQFTATFKITSIPVVT